MATATVNMSKLSNRAEELRTLCANIDQRMRRTGTGAFFWDYYRASALTLSPAIGLGYAIYRRVKQSQEETVHASLESRYKELITKQNAVILRYEAAQKELEQALRDKGKRLAKSERSVKELQAEISQLRAILDEIAAFQAKVA
jgi:uncharacterized protein HemX